MNMKSGTLYDAIKSGKIVDPFVSVDTDITLFRGVLQDDTLGTQEYEVYPSIEFKLYTDMAMTILGLFSKSSTMTVYQFNHSGKLYTVKAHFGGLSKCIDQFVAQGIDWKAIDAVVIPKWNSEYPDLSLGAGDDAIFTGLIHVFSISGLTREMYEKYNKLSPMMAYHFERECLNALVTKMSAFGEQYNLDGMTWFDKQQCVADIVAGFIRYISEKFVREGEGGDGDSGQVVMKATYLKRMAVPTFDEVFGNNGNSPK